MSVFTQALDTRTEVLDMGTLASNTFTSSSAIDLGATIPLDVTLEVYCTPSGATTSIQQLRVFIQMSLNNTDWTTGPTTGTDKTNIFDLHALGGLPCGDASLHRRFFNLSGMPVARYIKVIVFNDTGVALSSGKVFISKLTGVVT